MFVDSNSPSKWVPIEFLILGYCSFPRPPQSSPGCYCLIALSVVGYIIRATENKCRSQWPRVVRRMFATARLLRSWVRIPPGVWMFVCCECRVLSGRGLCEELITRPEESYRLWCVVVCNLESLVNEEAMTRVGSLRHKKQTESK